MKQVIGGQRMLWSNGSLLLESVLTAGNDTALRKETYAQLCVSTLIFHVVMLHQSPCNTDTLINLSCTCPNELR